MRRLLVVALFILVPALAFAETLESRSPQHTLTVEPAGTDEYNVSVTSIATGQRLMLIHLALKNDVAEASLEGHDLVVRVRLTKLGSGVSATATVERGGTIIETIGLQWRPGRKDALRVGGDVKAPVIITKVEPRYSEEARQARISGIVILEVLIDKTGIVQEATVLKGLPNGLSEAAVEAVRQWLFVPATKNGEAVDVMFNLTINFRLDRPRKPQH